MDLITTHTNADMDALASMVAAQKIYPGAVMVFPGILSRNVEEFMALHKDTLNVMSVSNINAAEIDRIILVDTRTPGRLDKLAALCRQPGVEIHVYDHHPKSEDDIRGKVEVVEMVGATTTLLVEKIREQGIKLTPLEATILSLGIYEDTGSLIFAHTTARDAQAVAYLLHHGANLAVVADFLERPLTDEQRILLKKLLVSAECYQFYGLKMLIAKGKVGEFVGGLSLLTHKLADFSHPDAVFAVVEMEERVYVVARSKIASVNVREILAELGGGGHAAAASVTIKNKLVDDVVEQLLQVIKTKVRPPVAVADIMSTPVKTVTPETVIEEAGRVMLRYGHTGLPVVKREKIVGVISRRDVEKAVHHGLGHAPVKGFMNCNMITVEPEMPASIMRDLMVEHNIGRIPVLKEGKLVGIVSRTDVLRTLHGSMKNNHEKVYNYNATAADNIRDLILLGLSEKYIHILERAGEIASAMGCKVYGAGGIVRDVLLGVECLDIDLVVEGDGIEMARALRQEFGGRVRVHSKFYTATVLFPGGYQVDVATARVEFYQYPAAMPQIETSSLHQDLYRRDFTINAMAVSLNKENFGDIMDFFGGRADLKRGIIRVLHNLSFVEDPIRLLRAVRFEKRYRMKLEPQTLKLAREAVRNKMLARVSAERIWEELKHILMEPRPEPVLSRLVKLKLGDFLFPGVDYDQIKGVLVKLPRAIKRMEFWDLGNRWEQWLIYLLGVLHCTDRKSAGEICSGYKISKRYTDKVFSVLNGWQDAVNAFNRPEGYKNSELAKYLMSLPREAYPLLLIYLVEHESRRRFREVLTAIYYECISIDGSDLRSLGFKPGPAFKRALDAVWQARLDRVVCTREEELHYVREFLLADEGAMKNG
jgi:tRNA nucleotidyltransferase (CCA-adding enzyme)